MTTAAVPIPIRNIPVAKPFFGREEEDLVLSVLRSGWVSQGPRVQEFEEQFARYVGAPQAVAVSSCTTALHLALIAAGIGRDDEVICPSLSFIATANAIRYVGATPVFADIDPETYNLDCRRVEEAITRKTRALLVVHQVGNPAPMAELSAIAARHNLLVIEDAACAVGAEYRREMLGAPHSLMACFSFHPRKVLTTGEGGMITTKYANIAARLRRLRQHAMTINDLERHKSNKIVIESYDEVGWNFRMTDLQAAIGLVQLRRLPDFLHHRRELAARYTKGLASLRWLRPPKSREGALHSYQSYMMRVAAVAPLTRNNLMERMLARGISTRRGIMSIHREAPYSDPKWNRLLPETEAASDNCIILPLYHQMTADEQDYVIESIHSIAAQA